MAKTSDDVAKAAAKKAREHARSQREKAMDHRQPADAGKRLQRTVGKEKEALQKQAKAADELRRM